MTESKVNFPHEIVVVEEYDDNFSRESVLPGKQNGGVSFQGSAQAGKQNNSDSFQNGMLPGRQYFIREGFYNFVVFELASESNELRMLLENGISPVLPRELRYIDGFPRLYYHIEGRQTVELVYEKAKLNEASLRRLLQSLCHGLGQIREYLLSYDDLVLDAEHVYWNWEGEVYEYTYLPGYGISIEEQLLRFVEYLLQHVDYQDAKAANLIYQLYEKLRKKGASIELLHEFCGDDSTGDNVWENAGIHLEARNDIQAEDASWQADSPDDVQDLYAAEPGWRKWLRKFCQIRLDFAGKKHLEGDSTGLFFAGNKKELEKNAEEALPQAWEAARVIEEGVKAYQVMGQEKESATTLLKSEETPLRIVPETGGNPIIVPDEEKKIIGRQEKVCDYVLQGTDVSRIHAGIVCREGVLLLTDLNSSNGTYINGERIPIQEETILQKNDTVSFATIRFHVE